MGGKRIRSRNAISSLNTVKPIKKAIMICLAILFIAAVGVIVSTVELDFGRENLGTDGAVSKTYQEYIDFGTVENEVIEGCAGQVRPEGYDENIMNGLAVLLEKNKSESEKKYSVVVDMSKIEKEFYEEWKGKGNFDENGLLEEYIEERKVLSEKLKKEEISQEDYDEKLEGLADRYHSDLAELEQEKIDWMHLKRVKILVSFSGEELADGYYLIEADRGEIEELSGDGYILRLLGDGLKGFAENSEGNMDNALEWMLDNSEKEKFSVRLSLRVREGIEELGTLEARIKLSDFLSRSKLIEKYNSTVGFSVSYIIDGEEKYSAVDCELTLSKQEVLNLLQLGEKGVYLSFACKEENVEEYAEYFYSVYGDGVFKNIKEIKG